MPGVVVGLGFFEPEIGFLVGVDVDAIGSVLVVPGFSAFWTISRMPGQFGFLPVGKFLFLSRSMLVTLALFTFAASG
ncbi:hypothetical protein ACQHIV_24490 [Kribbella sp. GL6]|uniref:hypothetical protein n=1 Tax=Kribbella sp. GL6 TaxID=3419765 RepID=UPI003D003417